MCSWVSPLKAKCSDFVEASLAETWDGYFEPRGWPIWVDAFAGVVALDGYPETEGTLVWRTGAAGRGEVRETVVAHEPRRLHRVKFSDPTMTGELETTFAIEGEGTRISQAMTYRLVERGVFAFLGAFFVRSQVKRSLERSLSAFREHVAESRPR
jgi:hypothetical protein